MDLKKYFGIEGSDPMKALMNQIVTEMGSARKNQFDPLKPTDSLAYQNLKSGSAQDRATLARYMYENAAKVFSKPALYSQDNPRMVLFSTLMRSNLPIPAEELLDWCISFKNSSDKLARARAAYEKQKPHARGGGSVSVTYPTDALFPVTRYADRDWPIGLTLDDWPISFILQQVERKSKKEPLSDRAVKLLRQIRGWEEMDRATPYFGTNYSKIAQRIDDILHAADMQSGKPPRPAPYKKLGGDKFGDPLQEILAALPDDEADHWHTVFNIAATANASKPTKKFGDAIKGLYDAPGKEWLRRQLQDWLARAVAAPPTEVRHTYRLGQNEHEYVETNLYTKSNATLIKGLVWACAGFQDSKTINLIADLCEKTWQDQVAVANACLWYLGQTSGADVLASLSRLNTKAKKKDMRKKIGALIADKAAKAGITPLQLEERTVPTYGLANGEKTVAFADYALQIRAEGPGRVTQTWLKPDGTPQKTKPKIVGEKAALKKTYDKVKLDVASMKKTLTAQRDRIDRLFIENLRWPLDDITQHYIGHPLVGVLASRLIWVLHGETPTAAIWREGDWQDITGTPLSPAADTTVSLWHPVEAGVDETLSWRARLAEVGISQPMKQAHREVYLLTDAERETRVYSNRMASHMLKQHQMATLMGARGWEYTLMGAYDDGIDDQWATRRFVTTDLVAEFLIHKNWDSENFNDAGIFHYVGTDQLRFSRPDTTQEPLDRIPPRLLSEVMREADLFVGVASVGNDPAWFDQGPTPETRSYWQGYSFGDLDGFAETRRAVLKALIPRLTIRDVAHIEGKFLIVDGKLNTYKIHLGSSNILMAPGDRYLCIVPGGVTKARNVALPFEGDTRLSVILSKALMLAEDDKITAPDIVRQLKR